MSTYAPWMSEFAASRWAEFNQLVEAHEATGTPLPEILCSCCHLYRNRYLSACPNCP